MKKAKFVTALIFLVLLSALWAEGMRFAFMFSIGIASVLLTVAGALLRAPEGYENENGFHIRSRRGQARLRPVLAMSASRT